LSGDISAGAVNTVNIATDAIKAWNLDDSNIDETKIAANTITANSIAADAITASELANDSVASANIINGSIGREDIAVSTITAEHILPNIVQAIKAVSQGTTFLTVDASTFTMVAGTNVTFDIFSDSISINSVGAVANVLAGDGLTRTGSDGTYTFAVGAGDGMSVSADSIAIISSSFNPTWAGIHTFSDQPIFSTSGEAPFSVNGNANAVSNLNADLLDGYTTGNATGNIPLSNEC
jgi:hypothetical protein